MRPYHFHFFHNAVSNSYPESDGYEQLGNIEQWVLQIITIYSGNETNSVQQQASLILVEVPGYY